MIDRQNLDTRIDGFAYLNSDRYIHAWTDIHDEVLATLDWIREPRLREIYDLWTRHNELRDTEMVNNIADYVVRNGFVHGVLLVGAGHKKSIVDKSRIRIEPVSRCAVSVGPADRMFATPPDSPGQCEPGL